MQEKRTLEKVKPYGEQRRIHTKHTQVNGSISTSITRLRKQKSLPNPPFGYGVIESSFRYHPLSPPARRSDEKTKTPGSVPSKPAWVHGWLPILPRRNQAPLPPGSFLFNRTFSRLLPLSLHDSSSDEVYPSTAPLHATPSYSMPS